MKQHGCENFTSRITGIMLTVVKVQNREGASNRYEAHENIKYKVNAMCNARCLGNLPL